MNRDEHIYHNEIYTYYDTSNIMRHYTVLSNTIKPWFYIVSYTI
jgi:hypothetical protein